MASIFHASIWAILSLLYMTGAAAENIKAASTIDSEGSGLKDANSDTKVPDNSATPVNALGKVSEKLGDPLYGLGPFFGVEINNGNGYNERYRGGGRGRGCGHYYGPEYDSYYNEGCGCYPEEYRDRYPDYEYRMAGRSGLNRVPDKKSGDDAGAGGNGDGSQDPKKAHVDIDGGRVGRKVGIGG